MPNADIPAILAVADSIALPVLLTDQQRAEALEAIALFRAISGEFTERAEEIIADGTQDSTELFNVAMAGAHISTAHLKICRALWAMEEAVFEQRRTTIAAIGKEGSTNYGSST